MGSPNEGGVVGKSERESKIKRKIQNNNAVEELSEQMQKLDMTLNRENRSSAGRPLFVYCGHGAGGQYLSQCEIYEKQSHNCSAAILMGCSSGHLKQEGLFEPQGMVLAYLLAGSPC